MWNLTSQVGSTLSWSAEFKHRNILAINDVHVCGDWQHLKGHWVKGKVMIERSILSDNVDFQLVSGFLLHCTTNRSILNIAPIIQYFLENGSYIVGPEGSLSMTLCRAFSRTFLFQKTPPAGPNLSQSPAPFAGMISSPSPIAARHVFQTWIVRTCRMWFLNFQYIFWCLNISFKYWIESWASTWTLLVPLTTLGDL
jgi:hypothetical protein